MESSSAGQRDLVTTSRLQVTCLTRRDLFTVTRGNIPKRACSVSCFPLPQLQRRPLPLYMMHTTVYPERRLGQVTPLPAAMPISLYDHHRSRAVQAHRLQLTPVPVAVRNTSLIRSILPHLSVYVTPRRRGDVQVPSVAFLRDQAVARSRRRRPLGKLSSGRG